MQPTMHCSQKTRWLHPMLLSTAEIWIPMMASQGVVRHHIVEWNGEPIKSVKTAFRSAVAQAGLGGKVTPHTLRHTAATWLMQAGVDKWEAAGFLGMTVELLDRVYGHHHPQHQRAAKAIGYRPRTGKIGETLGRDRKPRATPQQAIEIIGGPGRTRTCNQTVMSGRL